MDAAKIGHAIKILRQQAGFTQHALADCLHVTDKAVSKWERGLSIPDVSIVTKLSILLNCDIDNLLDGNITYLDKTWQGLLVLNNAQNVFAKSEVYGKPVVYFFLSYFVLAGIDSVWVSCSKQDKEFLQELSKRKNMGINLKFLPENTYKLPIVGNTMVVYNNPFVYGINLTKYFQRAMSRKSGISILTVEKNNDRDGIEITCGAQKQVIPNSANGIKRVGLPILFFPQEYFYLIEKATRTEELASLFSEPMGNGMIAYTISDEDCLWDTTVFLRYMEKKMRMDIYDLEHIARKRKFI